MYEQLLEIAFEAEIKTEESDELMALASQLCDEDPATRESAIMELREMIYERGECLPYRTDDEFLLRFLRSRYFVVRRAHRHLVRYCNFLEQYPQLYKGVDLFSLVKIKNVYEGCMVDHPDVGRLTICRLGTWNIKEFPVDELMKAGLMITEITMRQPKLQIFGFTVVIDLEGLTLRHVANLTPTIAYQIVSIMGAATPNRMKGCHLINYSWILNTFLYLFKRFIPQEANDKIFFHGYDLKSLQKHIRAECLPIRYGGTCRNHVSNSLWLQKIKIYRDQKFDNDMKAVGYAITE